MTLLLRVMLIIVSVLTMVLILRKIRLSKMRIEDSVFWIGFSGLLILFSVFPKIVYLMSWLCGTQTPANFIFLFVIFLLIVRLFRMTVKISELETKLQELVQKIAIDEAVGRDEACRDSGAGREETRSNGGAGRKETSTEGGEEDRR